MIYETELRNLITQWGDRLKMREYDTSYCGAVNDCIYDLENMLKNLHQEESEMCDPFAGMSDQEMKELYEDMVADSYLMSEHYF